MGKTLGKTFLGLELGWEGIMVSDEKTLRRPWISITLKPKRTRVSFFDHL